MTPAASVAADVEETVRRNESHAHRIAKTLLARWLREAAALSGYDNYARFPRGKRPVCHECLHDSSSCEWPYCCLAPEVSWCVNRRGPMWGVWLEYPVLSDGTGITRVWDEIHDRWRDRAPTYTEIVKTGFRPMAVVDIAIQHKGTIAYAIEIVHKHHCEPRKLTFLREYLTVLEIPAHWVLGQVDRPKAIPAEFFL